MFSHAIHFLLTQRCVQSTKSTKLRTSLCKKERFKGTVDIISTNSLIIESMTDSPFNNVKGIVSFSSLKIFSGAEYTDHF